MSESRNALAGLPATQEGGGKRVKCRDDTCDIVWSACFLRWRSLPSRLLMPSCGAGALGRTAHLFRDGSKAAADLPVPTWLAGFLCSDAAGTESDRLRLSIRLFESCLSAFGSCRSLRRLRPLRPCSAAAPLLLWPLQILWVIIRAAVGRRPPEHSCTFQC